jgi:DHA1 family tetracycline resistance protein-like MFS transporter
MYAYVADITEPQNRGSYYGILGAAGGFGFMVGPAIGGLAGELSLTAPLYVAAFVTFLNMLWGYFALPESLPKEKRSGTYEWNHLNPFLPFAHVFTSRTLVVAFAASFLFFFGGTMLQSNISVFLKDILSFGPGGIGAVLFVVGIMDIVSQGFLTGKLLPIFGEVVLARIGLFINAIGFLMLAMIPVYPSAVFMFAGIIIFNLGDGLFQPAASGLIANSAPQGKQGSIQGASQGQQSIARILGPLASAFLYPMLASGPYLAGTVVVFLGMALLFILPKKNS